MEEKNLTIVKSNKLIEASYKLGLDEQRLLLACISQIDSRLDLSKKDEFTVTAKQFASMFGSDPKSAYKQIEAAAEDLFERKIVVDNKKAKIKFVSRWSSSVEYNYGEGSVTIGFSQKILPLISQLKEQFTKYNIEHVSRLTSVHAIRIYELCLQYLKIGERNFEIDDFKKTLGLEDQYPEFKDFNKRVLKSSVDQINKHTDIKIKVNPIRKNRKIISLKFDIESKKPRAHKISNQKINKELTSISKSLDQYLQ